MSVHVLSYLHDPHHAGLAAELERARDARTSRARRIVALLHGDFGLTWDEVEQHVGPDAVIGRPHIADALVARGDVRDRNEAFAELLHHGSKYYVKHYAPVLLAAVMLVRGAGGVGGCAHTGADSRARLGSGAASAAMAASGRRRLEVRPPGPSPAAGG